MNKQVNQYKKENDIIVENVLTSELLRMNLQKSHVTFRGAHNKIDHEHDELCISFVAEDPCSIEERDFVVANPNEPLLVTLSQKKEVDRLIETLQRFRTEIWGN
jgi:hypothetical protein